MESEGGLLRELLAPAVPCFTLTLHSQDKYRVQFRNIAIQRDVSACAGGDHQLALAVVGGASDIWAGFQDIQRRDDGTDALDRRIECVFEQESKYPLEVFVDTGREDYARHGRVFGGLAFLPLAFVCR